MALSDQKNKASAANDSTPEKIRFNYIKSNQFRTIHYDGMHGGLTPQGKIQLAIFSERFPIPTETVHKVEKMEVGEELLHERVSRTGIVREIEANIVMDIKQAKSMQVWLDGRIKELEKLNKPKS